MLQTSALAWGVLVNINKHCGDVWPEMLASFGMEEDTYYPCDYIKEKLSSGQGMSHLCFQSSCGSPSGELLKGSWPVRL